MEITEKYIRNMAYSNELFQRGKNYYKNGRIKSYSFSNNLIIAKVSGRSLYNLAIQLNRKNKKMNWKCTCPYEGMCKHIIAVLLKYSEKKKDESSKDKYLFKNLFFEDVVNDLDEERILKAFNFVNDKKIKLSRKKRFIHAIIEDNGKNYNVSVEGGSEYQDLNEYDAECSCNSGAYVYDMCEHIASVYLYLLKTDSPNKIPKNYEKELEDSLNNEKYLEFVSLLSMKDTKEKFVNRYKIVFEIMAKQESIHIIIKKAYILKNGQIGTLTHISKNVIEEMYPTLSDIEKRIVDLLEYGGLEHRNLNNINNNSRVNELLRILKNLYSEDPESIVGCYFPNEKALIEISINQTKKPEEDYRMLSKIRVCGNLLDLDSENIILIGDEKLWALVLTDTKENKNILIEIETNNINIIKKLKESSSILIKNRNILDFIASNYLLLSKIGNLELPDKYKPLEKIFAPRPRLFLKERGDSFYIELRFLYEDNEVFYGTDYDILYEDKNGKLVKIKRNKEEEIFVQKLCMHSKKDGEIFLPFGEPIKWFFEDAPILISEGFEIFGDDKLLKLKINRDIPKLSLKVESGIDWFDLKTEIKFGTNKVLFENISDALKNNERFIKLSDGSIGAIPKKWLSKIAGVIGFLDENKKTGILKARHSQMGIVESLLEIADKVESDNKFDEIKKKFRNFKGIKEVSPPKTLKGDLRPYQKAGYDWLHFLKEFSFGGCLADEMGLGKTIQIISLLLYEKENGNTKQSLVVVPTSLVFNWVSEIKKFAPSLKTYVHHGNTRADNLEEKDADLIITTYGVLQNDIDMLKNKVFYYIILDESQKIKNPLSKNARCVLRLNSSYRVVLTGTPIENNLLELWSQFAFLNPGLLGNVNYFKKVFMKNIGKDKDDEGMTSLRNIINPFLLMRKKSAVAKDLPEKQIITLYCEMNQKQRDFYEYWKEKFRGEIKDSIEKEGLAQSRFKIIAGLTRLRQICNHPLLVDESFMGDSSKFGVIVDKINSAIENGHKVLLFSSFVKMLHLFSDYFKKNNIKFAYLDGHTKNREETVKRFQENFDVKLFLISIKAGGLGLNLTAADYVFIVDPWWNPAVEMQAMDRTHRIGQDKNIFVYKTIVKDSVEEKILELQNKKTEIAQNVINEQGIFKNLNAEDIKYIFG